MHLTGIEIDKDILDIAQNYFGLPKCNDNERLSMHIGNGLSITSESSNDNKIVLQESYYNIIIIDVDSKDNSVGMSCPPIEFINISYLQILKQLLCVNSGVLAINVCARDVELKQVVITNVCAVFEKVYISKSHDYDDELNIVLFATCQGNEALKDYDRVKSLHAYCDNIKDNASSSTLDSLLSDLEEFIIGIEEINFIEDVTENKIKSGKDKSVTRSKKKQKSKKKKGKR